jgi:hypothetical protein
MVEELFPDAQHILDFFHLCENVNTFAKGLFPTDDAKRTVWAKRVCDMLKEGLSAEVLKELHCSGHGKLHGCTVNLRGYIENNINHIDYPSYVKKGYFIGSGSIESGNNRLRKNAAQKGGEL